jgi:hypothetical protein
MIEVKRQMLVAAGVPPEQAALEAAGQVVSRNTLANVYRSIAQNSLSQAEIDQKMAVFGPDWRQRLGMPAQPPAPPQPEPQPQGPGFFQRMFGGGSATPPQQPPAQGDSGALGRVQAPPAGQPPAAAAAAPTPAPTPAAPAPAAATPRRPLSVPPGSEYSPSRNQWRDGDGKIYDAYGKPLA